MLGHKRILSREGGIEIVVEELATGMVKLGNEGTCSNRRDYYVRGKEFDAENLRVYSDVQLKYVFPINRKGLFALTSSVLLLCKLPLARMMLFIFIQKVRALCCRFQSCLEKCVATIRGA